MMKNKTSCMVNHLLLLGILHICEYTHTIALVSGYGLQYLVWDKSDLMVTKIQEGVHCNHCKAQGNTVTSCVELK